LFPLTRILDKINVFKFDKYTCNIVLDVYAYRRLGCTTRKSPLIRRWPWPNTRIFITPGIFIHINATTHSGYFYSASSSPQLHRNAPDYGHCVCVGVHTPKRYRQRRVKDLSVYISVRTPVMRFIS